MTMEDSMMGKKVQKKVNVDLPVRQYSTTWVNGRWSGKKDEDGFPLLMHPHPQFL